ncbi:MAG: hypothetical protein KF830_10135 [Planctomycetes bacterium]|nr:hypothetical protein [Planctomycetota bacterium]
MIPGPSFAQQRLVGFALLLGMIFYAVVAAVLLQQNDGKGLAVEPIPVLDLAAPVVGASLGLAAFVLRSVLRRGIDTAPAEQRSMQRFRAMIVPLALLEGGCVLALTVWLLNGHAVPALAVALVLLALAIVVVPFQDPDVGRA